MLKDSNEESKTTNTDANIDQCITYIGQVNKTTLRNTFKPSLIVGWISLTKMLVKSRAVTNYHTCQ